MTKAWTHQVTKAWTYQVLVVAMLPDQTYGDSSVHWAGSTRWLNLSAQVLGHLAEQPDDVGHTRVALNRRAGACYLQALPHTTAAPHIAAVPLTMSGAAQNAVSKSLVKKAGRLLAPAHKRKLIVFVDDASLPVSDGRGIRSAHALMMHQINYGTWFDYAKLEQVEPALILETALARGQMSPSRLWRILTDLELLLLAARRRRHVIPCCNTSGTWA